MTPYTRINDIEDNEHLYRSYLVLGLGPCAAASGLWFVYVQDVGRIIVSHEEMCRLKRILDPEQEEQP